MQAERNDMSAETATLGLASAASVGVNAAPAMSVGAVESFSGFSSFGPNMVGDIDPAPLSDFHSPALEPQTAAFEGFAPMTIDSPVVTDTSLPVISSTSPESIIEQPVQDTEMRSVSANTLEQDAAELIQDVEDPDSPHSDKASLERLKDTARQAGLQDLPAVKDAEEQFEQREESEEKPADSKKDESLDEESDEKEDSQKQEELDEQEQEEEEKRKREEAQKRQQQQAGLVLQPELDSIRAATLVAAGNSVAKDEIVDMRQAANAFEPVAQESVKSDLALLLGLPEDGSVTAIAIDAAGLGVVRREQLSILAASLASAHTGVRRGLVGMSQTAPAERIAEVTQGAGIRRLAGMTL